MKKVLGVVMMLALVFTLSACGEDEPEQGDYKPGLHLGYSEGNENSYAYVYVDEDGFIDDIFIDSVYTKRDSEGGIWELGDDPDSEDTTKYIATTKMSLDDGCGYNMHRDDDGNFKEVKTDDDGDCYVEDEMMWWEQVEALGDDIVENQGVPSYSLSDGKFEDDAISGVSITVDYLITAVENAIEQAELGEDESPSDFDVPEFDEEGDYEPGILFGYSDPGMNSVAVGAVNDEGNLVHMKIDTVYFKSTDEADASYETVSHGSETQGIVTTKMSLDYGCEYGMAESVTGNDVEYADDGTCSVEDGLMWWEQVQLLADDVVENQGVPSYSLDGGKFADDADDAFSGVSITVTGYIDAIEDALE